MTKDNWIKAFRRRFGIDDDWDSQLYHYLPSGLTTANKEVEDFISQVEHDAIEKTNKRLIKIARLAKFWGDRPHVCPKCNHRFSEDALAEYIKKELSDLLDDSPEYKQVGFVKPNLSGIVKTKRVNLSDLLEDK